LIFSTWWLILPCGSGSEERRRAHETLAGSRLGFSGHDDFFLPKKKVEDFLDFAMKNWN